MNDMTMPRVMERKSIPLEFKADGEEGEISGYGAVFDNIDSYGDRIAKGAFAATLKKRMPKMFWQHDSWDPIGRWTEASEDESGLYLKGKLTMGSTRGRDAYALIKDGAIDGLSIGYRTEKAEMVDNVRELREVDLWEVSVVSIGANDKALIDAVKSGELTEREFERFLRNNGFDRTAAKIITAEGWKGYRNCLRDAGVSGPEADQRDADELKQAIKQMLEKMEVKQ
jgi:HK97 family phage prohead protease